MVLQPPVVPLSLSLSIYIYIYIQTWAMVAATDVAKVNCVSVARPLHPWDSEPCTLGLQLTQMTWSKLEQTSCISPRSNTSGHCIFYIQSIAIDLTFPMLVWFGVNGPPHFLSYTGNTESPVSIMFFACLSADSNWTRQFWFRVNICLSRIHFRWRAW